MKKIVLLLWVTASVISCKKNDVAPDAGETVNPVDANSGNPAGLSNNTCKIIKPDGSEVLLSFTTSYAQAESGLYYFQLYDNASGNSVKVNFKTAPSDGEYPICCCAQTFLNEGAAVV